MANFRLCIKPLLILNDYTVALKPVHRLIYTRVFSFKLQTTRYCFPYSRSSFAAKMSEGVQYLKTRIYRYRKPLKECEVIMLCPYAEEMRTSPFCFILGTLKSQHFVIYFYNFFFIIPNRYSKLL